MKIFIDTNIWISYFLSRSFNNLNLVFSNDAIQIFTSSEQLDEIQKNYNEKPFYSPRATKEF